MKRINYYNFIYYLIIGLSAISLAGGLVYKLWSLNWLGIIISLILALAIIILVARKDGPPRIDTTQQKTSKIWPQISYWLLLILSFYFLIKAQTNDALISPWEVVAPLFFLFFSLLTLNLIYLIREDSPQKLLHLSSFLFLIFSVALLVYKLGYGFDPFIHEAALNYIDQHGFTLPKSFYYLGHYGLVIILHKLSFIDISLLNQALVPVLAALFLPYSLWQSKTTPRNLTLLLLLILPFSIFIISTPQNLAYLFLLLTIIWVLNQPRKLFFTGLLAFNTLFIHPLAGIPALLFWFLTLTIHKWPRHKKAIQGVIFSLSALLLPLAFMLSSQKLSWSGWRLGDLNLVLTTWSSENLFLNLNYYWHNYLIIAIIAFSLFGFKKIRQEIKKSNLLILSLGLTLGYLILSGFNFNSLIIYEQANYANRLLVMAVIFILPLIYSAGQEIITKIKKEDLSIRIISSIFLTLFISSSLYFSYPRLDYYHNSHGFSTSSEDLEAVQWIENNSQTDYIVLANQQVSAGALKIFGFNRYHNGYYFYPTPTGGEMYQYYLQMVENGPKKETMAEAMALGGVSESYFIINKYWWAADRIIAEAQSEAQEWKKFKNLFIFRY